MSVAAGAVPRAALIETARPRLEHLRVEHAGEMATALDDPGLHEFIGGRPATAAELTARSARLAAGPADGGAAKWLNWIVRDRAAAQAIGTVQATLKLRDGKLVAELGWVIVAGHQRRGYAKEAVNAVVAWLRDRGVTELVAHIHPGHRASIAVARSAGLAPTDVVIEGETRWETPVPRGPPGRCPGWMTPFRRRRRSRKHRRPAERRLLGQPGELAAEHAGEPLCLLLARSGRF